MEYSPPSAARTRLPASEAITSTLPSGAACKWGQTNRVRRMGDLTLTAKISSKSWSLASITDLPLRMPALWTIASIRPKWPCAAATQAASLAGSRASKGAP
ncbi:hypothetical protein G6F65_014487 [Rhizopus arrhizus]|nr:hypothetical protein G6F65_014487 [Rhizopus arrhizus]